MNRRLNQALLRSRAPPSEFLHFKKLIMHPTELTTVIIAQKTTGPV